MKKRWVLAAILPTLGFLAGRWSAPSPAPPPDPVPAQPAPEEIPRAPSPERAPPLASAPTTDEACALDLELAQQTITELEHELYGPPLPWPDDIPEIYRPEAVKARIQAASPRKRRTG